MKSMREIEGTFKEIESTLKMVRNIINAAQLHLIKLYEVIPEDLEISMYEGHKENAKKRIAKFLISIDHALGWFAYRNTTYESYIQKMKEDFPEPNREDK